MAFDCENGASGRSLPFARQLQLGGVGPKGSRIRGEDPVAPEKIEQDPRRECPLRRGAEAETRVPFGFYGCIERGKELTGPCQSPAFQNESSLSIV
jgi:hypothetical protein